MSLQALLGVVRHLVVERIGVDVNMKSSGISLAFSAAAGSSLQDSGTLSDHGRNESTTSSVSSPALGISVSSHST
jgi:hypothetical protein